MVRVSFVTSMELSVTILILVLCDTRRIRRCSLAYVALVSAWFNLEQHGSMRDRNMNWDTISSGVESDSFRLDQILHKEGQHPSFMTQRAGLSSKVFCLPWRFSISWSSQSPSSFSCFFSMDYQHPYISSHVNHPPWDLKALRVILKVTLRGAPPVHP